MYNFVGILSGGKQRLEIKETFNYLNVCFARTSVTTRLTGMYDSFPECLFQQVFAHDAMPTVNPVASGLAWLDVCGAIHDPRTSEQEVKAGNES